MTIDRHKSFGRRPTRRRDGHTQIRAVDLKLRTRFARPIRYCFKSLFLISCFGRTAVWIINQQLASQLLLICHDGQSQYIIILALIRPNANIHPSKSYRHSSVVIAKIYYIRCNLSQSDLKTDLQIYFWLDEFDMKSILGTPTLINIIY